MTWHRPHLALFEVCFLLQTFRFITVIVLMKPQQSLRANVFAAVNEFPDGAQKQRYLDAAVKVRLPYWDWAKAPDPGLDIMPTSVVKPVVELIGPRGKITVENPLLQYRFMADSGPPGGKDFPLPKNVSINEFPYLLL
jgi:tyrosinase